MALFARAPRPPAQLRSRLDGGERVLAMADEGPATVLATQLALWLPIADPTAGSAADSTAGQTPGGQTPDGVDGETSGWRRVGWDEVVKATWTDAGLEVVEGVTDAYGIITDQPPARYRLDEPRNLPIIVRQRVEQSIGRWEQVKVPGGTGRIIGRRRPGSDGVVWTARIDLGTPASAAADAVLRGYLERLRALPPEELAEF